MLEALFRLLGVDLNRKLAEVRGHIDELKRSAISEATEQVKETGLTVGLILGGAIAALFTFVIALGPSTCGWTCTKGLRRSSYFGLQKTHLGMWSSPRRSISFNS